MLAEPSHKKTEELNKWSGPSVSPTFAYHFKMIARQIKQAILSRGLEEKSICNTFKPTPVLCRE